MRDKKKFLSAILKYKNIVIKATDCYETPRQEIKKLKDDLDDYLEDDFLNDMEKTKDKEIEILQERINNWDDYLKMLEWQHNEAERIQRDKLLMDMLNVESMEEVDALMNAELDSYINALENNKLELKSFYDSYNGLFTTFLDEYKTNVLELAEL